MKIKKLVSALAAVGVGMAVAGAANAAIAVYSPIWAFEDDDIEVIIDNNSNGIIDIGDRIIAVGEVFNTAGIGAGQGPTPIGPEELTFVSDITLVSQIDLGGGLVSNIFAASGAAGLLAGFADGTTIAAWTDATPDLNVTNAACGNVATCASLAGLGGADGSNIFATFGFFGDPDEVWIGNPTLAGSSIAAVTAGGASTKFASFFFAQSVGINNTGVALGQQACAGGCSGAGDGFIDALGSGDFLGGQGGPAANGWNARSDSDIQLAPVPEPNSLALLGIALAGLGALRWRKS